EPAAAGADDDVGAAVAVDVARRDIDAAVESPAERREERQRREVASAEDFHEPRARPRRDDQIVDAVAVDVARGDAHAAGEAGEDLAAEYLRAVGRGDRAREA